MSRLRDNRDDLNALVNTVADWLGIPAAYVEKDFWLTEVLRVASTSRMLRLRDGRDVPVVFVFKGGTSLSRVYGLIERFSEDVDLLAVFPDGSIEESTDRARHAVLKSVDAGVADHIGVAGEATDSTTGVKRFTRYSYDTEHGESFIRPAVLLELGSRGGSTPAEMHTFRSMVARYAIETLGDAEDQWEEFASFDLLVLAPERTLLEKLAAVHAAAELNDGAARVKGARHYYDVYKLLNSGAVVAALTELGSTGVSSLANDIHSRSLAAGLPCVERPEGGFASSAAFDKESPTWAALSEAYLEVTESLVYGSKPSLDDILALVEARRELI